MNAPRLRSGRRSDIDCLVDIDNDASTLFETVGMHLDAKTYEEITAAARMRWLQCLERGHVLLAVEGSRQEVGFAALGRRDGEPYIDQLSVRRAFMGQGLGTALLGASIKSAVDMGGRYLWLTTYGHLSWNRPFYEREGFAVVPVEGCGEELQREVHWERSLFPEPAHRIVMRRPNVRRATG